MFWQTQFLFIYDLKTIFLSTPANLLCTYQIIDIINLYCNIVSIELIFGYNDVFLSRFSTFRLRNYSGLDKHLNLQMNKYWYDQLLFTILLAESGYFSNGRFMNLSKLRGKTTMANSGSCGIAIGANRGKLGLQ